MVEIDLHNIRLKECDERIKSITHDRSVYLRKIKERFLTNEFLTLLIFS